MEKIYQKIAKTLNIGMDQVVNTMNLLNEGNTVPFIARYRKEMTKGLDEEEILFISQEFVYQQNLAKRKEDVIRLIEVQGKITPEIIASVNACAKLSLIEDIYRPYQQKRKTRATDAVAKGLKPLADFIMELKQTGDVNVEALKYINDQVLTIEEAINGAKDIVAERVSDDPKFRWQVKDRIEKTAFISTKEKKKHEDEKKVYKMYYEHKEKLLYTASHRIMAMDRGEKEKVITVNFEYDENFIINYAIRKVTNGFDTSCLKLIEESVKDGCKRLLLPSVEREIRSDKSEIAHGKSIEVFSMNVERLLLQPPLESKMILGFDPAFRTGCKLAVIDHTGKMIEISVIYPHQPVNKIKESKDKLLALLKKYPIEIIAIGNGTASRESESFVAELISENQLSCSYTIVSEAGASVYSASELARNEFPDLAVEQRSAISIARRILDPLSELIKIDPKSIGVGQYQHDLPNKKLTERLDFAILKAVNRVGVDLNTASVELLSHISGLNKSIAKEIVNYRNEFGEFNNRKTLLDVPKLGKKAYTQAAGFLRVRVGDEALDKTPIHPESYVVAKKIIKLYKIDSLGSEICQNIINEIDVEKLSVDLDIDMFTLNDILDAIKTPLRDYREQYSGPLLRKDILTINDLHVGDTLEGVVRNVVDFGAFVDIGLKEDGLIHISKITKEKITHASQFLSVSDIINVVVYKIDMERHKVQLSLID